MDLLSNLNTEILKVPLGFIRLLELPLVILAFATTSGYQSCFEYKVACTTPTTLPAYQKICWSYPFRLTEVQYRPEPCTAPGVSAPFNLAQDFVSPSQFFVFTGVVAFLYILASLAFYLLKWQQYDTDERCPKYDFIATAVFVLFWFAGSCAWASGVSGLKTITSGDEMKLRLLANEGICKTSPTLCTQLEHGDYASLNVSLILGFAIFAVFVANLWFIYKETVWWKSRQAGQFDQTGGQQQFGGGVGNPVGGAGNFGGSSGGVPTGVPVGSPTGGAGLYGNYGGYNQ